jgi:predicted nucleic acid-binding protein
MTPAQGYLLDTNVVLHATRQQSPVSLAVDRQFQLQSSPFRPAISEVTVAELWAFAQAWGEKRKELLGKVLSEFVVLPIGNPLIHQRWAELYSFARGQGLAIQHDHNDVWIAATAQVAGLKLLTTDVAAFLPLRGTSWLHVDVLDPKTGIIVP